MECIYVTALPIRRIVPVMEHRIWREGGDMNSLKLFIYINYRLNLVTAYVCKIHNTDRNISELQRRFTENSGVMQGVRTLHPSSKSVFDVPTFTYLAEHCSCDASSVHVKLVQYQSMLKRIMKKFSFQ